METQKLQDILRVETINGTVYAVRSFIFRHRPDLTGGRPLPEIVADFCALLLESDAGTGDMQFESSLKELAEAEMKKDSAILTDLSNNADEQIFRGGVRLHVANTVLTFLEAEQLQALRILQKLRKKAS